MAGSGSAAAPQIALGIDVGGTFTDVIALDLAAGRIVASFKLPTTPDDPSIAAVTGTERYLERTGMGAGAVYHGSTIGTNTLIQKRGARTALIATEGFRDILALRRQARPRLYDLEPRISPPLVPRERRLEAHERMTHDGGALTPLEPAEIERIVDGLRADGIEAVAVCLLHAYANDGHEQALGEAIRAALPGVFVSISSDVTSEFREYERTSTVVVNAYIGPTVRDYLLRLGGELTTRGIPRLAVVKSNGGLSSAANAERYPVHLIESGPAAGVIATAALGAAEGLGELIAFDMGGTTAKVGVIQQGQPRLSTEFHADRFVDGRDVGGYPIKSPVIDLIEIGSGGGSIAWLDPFGVLKVGPESAGADPGPACYGRGGTRPTVTDAHVALGHIGADGFGSEDLEIQVDLARGVLAEAIARPLGWTVERAAWGVLTLANANMAEVVRLATLRRGLDPRDFALVAFGGAGPLHATEIAREVGVPRLVIPPYPGLFSAIGTMLGDVRHDLVQTLLRRTGDLDGASLEEGFARLEARAQALFAEEEAAGAPILERHADLRFEGQMFEKTLPVARNRAGDADLDGIFRAAYRADYGYDLPEQPVEVVNLRLVARRPVRQGGWPAAAEAERAAGPGRRRRTILAADGSGREVEVLPRWAIGEGEELMGPLIIEDFGATIRVLDGQRLGALQSGTLVIEDGE
ncbi:MAG: hydantoinase/oxoprolinase family protein [Alphaproteobacteria bacterium]|jgi:N-methylhydantoinase A|nr:hydantoinase/oxoprolinase family protein [Alphaproteobacteria bacterium]MDP6565299.1 hydantoinase/oxoprolinase family protein [Alphaproteobacteria bacterium]MDP6812068.1 hydantoinase/oxoprolinase family protein [Alphaproteobacteria bacterium]